MEYGNNLANPQGAWAYQGGNKLGSAAGRTQGGSAKMAEQNTYYQRSAEGALNPQSTSVNEAMKLIEADKEHRSLAADQALMLHLVMPSFGANLRQLQEGIFKWNKHQGFWPGHDEIQTREGRNLKKSEKVALMHTELSELLEGIRNGDYENEAEECADLLIRLLDYCGGFNIDLARALERKQLKNLNRPHRHGKQF